MFTTLLLSILLFATPDITITGHCYNLADNSVVKSNVTAVFRSSKKKLTAARSGEFKFVIPDSTLSLTFEAEGFETRSVPVNFVQKPEQDATFEITVAMLGTGFDQSVKDDETLFPRNMLFLHYDVPDSIISHIVLDDESARKISETRPILNSYRRKNLKVNYISAGPYTLSKGIYLPNENYFTATSSEKVVLKEGFNFLPIHYTKSDINEAISSRTQLTMLRPRTLYFDQSSYQLRKDSRLTLDSICQELVRRHNLIAQVTGHTDNVGKRNLNMILSEYRSRVVQQYMKTNGVPPGQIRIDWKGPDAPVVANDSEENKIRNRRVELRFVNNNKASNQ
ncbi:OmpA family protein [Dyadobacter luticola]|uniref:OmpA family protein n=1 Tax=Dyadobacter luticola TaxID=1979387 RepID=A0A5R9L1W2_9BACT|nr:OmpA family protein [Dyadobacter luticola]TLV02554.1 OmpA family protein [Dyadobacter luticola]